MNPRQVVQRPACCRHTTAWPTASTAAPAQRRLRLAQQTLPLRFCLLDDQALLAFFCRPGRFPGAERDGSALDAGWGRAHRGTRGPAAGQRQPACCAAAAAALPSAPCRPGLTALLPALPAPTLQVCTIHQVRAGDGQPAAQSRARLTPPGLLPVPPNALLLTASLPALECPFPFPRCFAAPIQHLSGEAIWEHLKQSRRLVAACPLPANAAFVMGSTLKLGASDCSVGLAHSSHGSAVLLASFALR